MIEKVFFGGPWENRTPTSRMQTERTTTMLKAHVHLPPNKGTKGDVRKAVFPNIYKSERIITITPTILYRV